MRSRRLQPSPRRPFVSSLEIVVSAVSNHGGPFDWVNGSRKHKASRRVLAGLVDLGCPDTISELRGFRTLKVLTALTAISSSRRLAT